MDGFFDLAPALEQASNDQVLGASLGMVTLAFVDECQPGMRSLVLYIDPGYLGQVLDRFFNLLVLEVELSCSLIGLDRMSHPAKRLGDLPYLEKRNRIFRCENGCL